MPESGHTWRLNFKGHAADASAVRAWVRERVHHPDAPPVAHELFVALLGSGADIITLELSTAGPRLRITASGPAPLPARHSHGPGWRIIAGLSQQTGLTTDECGLWAQMENGR
ncbi:hypothetical protein G9272_31960 [Streptomyces asoensis]|uniref:Uncharacterized protein n=1 Tax=Streptomyces asoensis TaxID=249586 RepID=A0A6M4WYA4_9ACTN|nr:hypothetical protein [Streptomyces asoensis]QJT04335.1 hypothetical protein G9272_31960 [Streptomyces asoensis]